MAEHPDFDRTGDAAGPPPPLIPVEVSTADGGTTVTYVDRETALLLLIPAEDVERLFDREPQR